MVALVVVAIGERGALIFPGINLGLTHRGADFCGGQYCIDFVSVQIQGRLLLQKKLW